jgi:preprotein translocase subunit SecD
LEAGLGKKVQWRVLLILLVLVGAIAGFVLVGYARARKDMAGAGSPTLKDALKSAIKLGLDLRGGIHLVLQVNTADAVKAERDDAVELLKNETKDAKIGAVELPTDTSFSVTVTSETDQAKLEDVSKRFLSEWTYTTGGGKWTFALKDVSRRQIEDNAVAQALETIRNRIDEFGVSEPLIARQGKDRILVQLPGIDDPKRVKDLIKNTAFLELSLVEAGPSTQDALTANYPGGKIPDQFKLVEAKAESGNRERSYYVVRRQAVITGRDLKNARPTQGQFGSHSVTFFLTASGSQKFGVATGANIGKRLAIILDNRAQSAPSIKDRITDQGVIEGTFSPEEANDLALVLRAGALPAGLTYLEERTVGPSLGLDSIRKGVTASVVGALLVFVAMALYYRRAGWNAIIALILNAVLLAAAMALFEATLTLPGIAGFILTIGMAVDSNVLVFERIREELRNGRAPRAAIENGFSKAFATIVDTHATTIISALFLLQFGTGPVKGFAVTLIIGLLISMFTAVFVSHTIFELEYGRRQHIDAVSI